MKEYFMYNSDLCLNMSRHLEGIFFQARPDAQLSITGSTGDAEKLFGYLPGTLLEMIHPDDRQVFLSQLESHLKSSLVLRHRFRISFSGEYKTCECVIAGKKDENGNTLFLEGFIRNLSSEGFKPITLEKHDLDYGNVLENISDGLIIDNIEGKVVFANDQFLSLMGIERNELDSFVFDDYVSDEFKKEIRERHKKRMNGEDVTETFEYLAVRKDGVKRWFEARVTKIEHGGRIIGTQSAIRDIHDERTGIDLLIASEFEKTNLLKELNKRYNELMQFNYIVSHNLRAPIANILGLSDMFDMPGIGETERKQIVKHIQSSIQGIDELINDLNIILAAKSDINSKKELVRFAEVIKQVEATMEKQFSETGAKLVLKIDKQVETIYSIKSYIKSAIFNLMSNAIKYRKPDERPVIVLDIFKNGEDIAIHVQDNGIGIDLKRHGSEMFGLYKRFNHNSEGKGLGLNMTKNQIEALGGSIEVESSPGSGTIFRISLPDNTNEA